jgi:hypothetical protein
MVSSGMADGSLSVMLSEKKELTVCELTAYEAGLITS